MADPDLLLLDEPVPASIAARERLLHVVADLAKRARPTLLLVTHHIEEVAIASFSHVLVLRGGRVVAQGLKECVLTSEILSHAFDHPITVRHREDRFELTVDRAR